MITVENLTKRFGEVTAVEGLTFQVEEGEVFGFLGPNGAGKSTAVRMLTTLLRPTSGTARVAGYAVVKDADMVRRSIGVALQDAAIDPLMTGAELLALQAVLYGIPQSLMKKRSDELLERVGLTAAASRRVSTYSGGMRRRLDLALSLIHQPTVLFLDEPTTGFDPEARRSFWSLIQTLRSNGTTILLTTHYLEEAEALADRVAVINNGVIMEVSTPAELGGRATSQATVTWRDGDHIKSERSDNPTELVTKLSSHFGGEVPELVVSRPSLEDIYLEMIGGTHE